MLDFGFYNLDCMEGMKEFPDNYFDLAIVDPPSGSGLTEGGGCRGWFDKYRPENVGGGTNWNRFGQRFDRYKYPQDRQQRKVERDCTAPERGNGTTRASQKNHSVGRSPETGIFRRTVSRFTKPDYLGGATTSIFRRRGAL